MVMQASAAPVKSGLLARVTLLFVEDDAIIRETLAKILGRRVGRLLLAADGAEGLRLFADEQPDIVLTDILMPVMNGLDMIEAIRRQGSDTPVLITTAFNETEHLRRAIDLGVDKYITKPVDVPHLLRSLERCAGLLFQEVEHELSTVVFDNSPVAILISDRENRILSVNPAFTEITGYSREAVIGHSPSLLASGRHSRDYYAEMWASLRARGKWSGEIWNRRANGETYPEWLSVNTVCNGHGDITHHVAIFSDITERKRSEERMQHLAHHDALTGLPNRVLLHDRLQQAMLQAERSSARVAVIFIDLDRFKIINDTLGHGTGDELLRQVGARLVSCVRQEDTVCRQGGDEFVILLPKLGELEAAARVARKILASLNQAFLVDGHTLRVSASIGISFFPEDGNSADSLMRKADAAMYRAKELGRDNFQFHLEDATSTTLERLFLESALRVAVDQGELRVHFQPLYDARTGRIEGAEALVRWQHSELGLLAPAAFIPLAEESGVINGIGAWVLRAACAEAAQWPPGATGSLQLAVNLSARQIRNPGFVESVIGILAETGFDPQRLELEVTESMLMSDASKAIATLAELRRLGMRISIDDFGTGYSSLSYLRHLPIDTLKIDRSFIVGVTENSTDVAIVDTILSLACNLGLNVIAEGVEMVEQRDFLAGRGCKLMQGYLFGKPLPPAEFVALLDSPA